MGGSRTLLRVIDQIYEAATDPSGLDGLALMLARVFDTESGCLTFNEMPEPEATAAPAILSVSSKTSNMDDCACRAYGEYFHARDVWVRAGLRKAMPAIMLGQQLVDERTLLQAEWYDFCKMVDVFHLLAAKFPITKDIVGHLGVHRSRKRLPFERADMRKMELLLPHLQRALQVHMRLNLAEQAHGLELNVLSGLGVGLIIATRNCEVHFANRIAEQVLQRCEGIIVSNRKLQAQDPLQTRTLEHLIFDAAQTSAGKGIGTGGLLVLNRSPGRSFSVLVSPLCAQGTGFGPAMPAALLIFSDPDNAEAASQPPEKVLSNAYGLTLAEACLAAAIAGGENLSSYAGRKGISPNTAKTQLRQVFAKTGCSRQADLVRMLYADLAVRLAQGQIR